MKYLHTMVRVSDLEEALDFYCNKLGLKEVRRYEVASGRFTLVFLAGPGDESAQLELTWNRDPEEYGGGRNFGHLAYEVDDIYATCGDVAEQAFIVLAANPIDDDGQLALFYINLVTDADASYLWDSGQVAAE